MKSIQTKFIVLTLLCVLIGCFATGGAGIWSTQKAVKEDSAQIMNLLCEEKAEELDALLEEVEQTACLLADTAQAHLDEDYPDGQAGEETLAAFTDSLRDVAERAIERIDEGMTVCIRMPGWTDAAGGSILLEKTEGAGARAVNPSEYDGWEQLMDDPPAEAGWTEPSYREDLDRWTTAYVAPLYQDGKAIGAVGIAIDREAISRTMEGVGVYDSGFAFLCDREGDIVYHPIYAYGTAMVAADKSLAPAVAEMEKGSSGESLFYYRYDGEGRALAFRTLRNGVRVAVTAPTSEINEGRDALIAQSLVTLLIVALVAVLLTVEVSHRIVRPLRELDAAAKKIAAGDFSTDIHVTTKDEVGTLAQSIRDMSGQIQRYVGNLSTLAYRDAMTGVRNKTAYLEQAHKMQERMEKETPPPRFALVMLDVNYLKHTNDTFGHDYGDRLIISGCQLICRVFDHSPVYRFGGDEFVVLLENRDFDNREELFKVFQSSMYEMNKTADERLRLSISWGIAVYDPKRDAGFSDVFKRADDAMYEHKKQITQGRREKH